MGEAATKSGGSMNQLSSTRVPRMRSSGARPLPGKGYYTAANDQLKLRKRPPQRPSVYEQSLLYPPFAIFDVDVVNAVLSNLSRPIVSMPTSPQPQWDSDLHRLEVQTLKALLISIDIDEPTKEGDTAGIPIARELALEGCIVAAVGRMCHRNRLHYVDSAPPLCYHNREDSCIRTSCSRSVKKTYHCAVVSILCLESRVNVIPRATHWRCRRGVVGHGEGRRCASCSACHARRRRRGGRGR